MNFIPLIFLLLLIIFGSSSPVKAWDFSFKGDLTQKSTDNVNYSSTDLVSDRVKVFGAYFQVKDENDRFRLRFKANRYVKIVENNSNMLEVSYQRKFSKDLSDSFQFKVFSEKYTTIPTIYGDTTSDNKGGEVQFALSRPMDKTLNLNAIYLVNYKSYVKNLDRTDYRFETSFGFDKSFKKVLTFAPEVTITYNNSKESYYTTFNFGINFYIGLELNEYVEVYFNYNWSKVNYMDRSFTLTKTGRTITLKEELRNSSREIGLNIYATDWLTIEAKYGNTKSNSNNTLNTYQANDWSLGASFRY